MPSATHTHMRARARTRMQKVFRVLNYVVVTYVLQLALPERKAVVISASQKTLPIAITVLGFLPPAVGEEGVMAIACIIAQLTQILVDSVLIGQYPGWGDEDGKDDAEEEVEEVEEVEDADNQTTTTTHRESELPGGNTNNTRHHQSTMAISSSGRSKRGKLTAV